MKISRIIYLLLVFKDLPLRRNSGDIYGCFCKRPHKNQPTYLTDLTRSHEGHNIYLIYYDAKSIIFG